VERGHQIVQKTPDIWIDFSHPDAVLKHVAIAAKTKTPIVIGTTGWGEHLDEVRELAKEIGVCYASNFSLGMQIFQQIVREAAELINEYDVYDVAGIETHHNEKVDSPSGSAITLAEILLEKFKRKKRVTHELGNRKREKDEIHFPSLRLGKVPGEHSIQFDSAADTITLTHTARNRSGFALGAIIAAENLGKQTGLFSFQELLNGRSVHV